MKPICIIPARGGSKEVHKKNTRIVKGKPLIAYTIESVIDSGIFKHVIVTSEDSEIIKIAKRFGAEAPFIRPKNLANSTASTDDVLIHATKKLLSLDYKFDVFVHRDCTVPFIDSIDIKGALDLLKRFDCNAVYGVCKAHPNPYFGMMELNEKGYLKPSKRIRKTINRRQDSPLVYFTHGLYACKSRQLLKHKTMLMPKTLPYEVPIEHGFMIDFEIQFKIAEYLFDLKEQSLL